jgi:hypothetical protein
MSVFRHTVMRHSVYHTLSTLHHKVLAVGAFWDNTSGKSEKQTFRLALARKRRPWFDGLWANAGEPLAFTDSAKTSSPTRRAKPHQRHQRNPAPRTQSRDLCITRQLKLFDISQKYQVVSN